MSDSTQETLREQIAADVDKVEWQALAGHARRENVVLVDSSLDLVDIAHGIATDQVDLIGPLMEQGLITKSEENDFEAEQVFRFVIIQPFVVVTPHAEED
ncbi:MAG: hypothetical protein CMH54_09715 [Myxococcales bacterium]|nr:hypothetical protein [Myxococcales bacterium]